MPTRKVILDKFEINILRLTYSDTEIRKMKKTSFWNLLAQCWTREEHGIPKVAYPVKKDKTKLIESRLFSDKKIIAKNERIWLKQDKWEQNKESNYWEDEKRFWKVINVGSLPLPWVVLWKNTVGYTF